MLHVAALKKGTTPFDFGVSGSQPITVLRCRRLGRLTAPVLGLGFRETA